MVTLKILGNRGVENREIEDLRIGKKQLKKRKGNGKKKIYRRTEKVEIRLRLGILDLLSTKLDPEENEEAQSVNYECNNLQGGHHITVAKSLE